MNIFHEIRKKIIEIVIDLTLEEGLDKKINFEKITVEVPKDERLGELSTNVALILSKPFGYKPIFLAEKLKVNARNSS